MSTARSYCERADEIPAWSPSRPALILIVDDEVLVREILARKLSSLGHGCECCDNGREALRLLQSKPYDLVLADILMPEVGGIDLLKQCREIRPETAVIMITSVVEIGVAVDSLKYGAYDYISKPFSLEQVSISVSRALEKRRLLIENQDYERTLEENVAIRTHQLEKALKTLQDTYHSTLVALSKALDSRHAGYDGHSLCVTMYTTRMARQLGIGGSDLRVIEQGVLLRDIGKIGIPDDLLHKSGRLAKSEWSLMRKHPEIGFRILSRIEFLKEAAKLVLHHHERYDGTGYPGRLEGNEINLGARIFAVAGALEFLVSDHSSRAASSFEAAATKVLALSGTRLDPTIVHEFSKIPLSEWSAISNEVAANATNYHLLAHPAGNGEL